MGALNEQFEWFFGLPQYPLHELLPSKTPHSELILYMIKDLH